MDLTIKQRNSKVSERQRKHIESKLGKLERFLDQIKSVTVEVSNEQRRNAGEVFRVQATLIGERGVILRAEQDSADLYTAVDEVQDVLERQIKRYKDKHWRRGKMRRQAGKFIVPEPVLTAESENEQGSPEKENTDSQYLDGEYDGFPEIVRMKEFKVRPMFTDEAVEQMELLGHTFFIFRDADTLRISVVYRRKDGNYGLIVVPEEG